jgi:hypothetical protein
MFLSAFDLSAPLVFALKNKRDDQHMRVARKRSNKWAQNERTIAQPLHGQRLDRREIYVHQAVNDGAKCQGNRTSTGFGPMIA